MPAKDDREISARAIANGMTIEELRDSFVELVGRVTDLTAAIKRKHPLAMGMGDGAVATAIHLIESCKCR